MVGDAQLAQDIVQEALTKTYVAWPRLRDPHNAEAYGRDSTSPPFVSAPGGAPTLTYAVGGVIHEGGTQTDVGEDVAGLVPTSHGVVFSDSAQRVFDLDGSGPREIGHLAQAATPLLVDSAGTTVAWLGADGLEVYRVGDRQPTTVPLQDPPGYDTPSVRAISDGTVWFWDARGTMTYDSGSGTLAHVAGFDAPAQVQDVVGDRVLAVAENNTGGYGLSVVRPPVAGPYPAQVTGTTSGDLSPDGDRWFTADGKNRDAFLVVDSATGRSQEPTYAGTHVTPYAWLDDDTIAAWTLPIDTTNPVDLLTCHVSTNTCAVAAPGIGLFGHIAIGGEPIA
jgi:WD40 repeat protein